MNDGTKLQFLIGTTDDGETVCGGFQKTGNFISTGHVGSGHASYDEGAFVANLLQNYSPDELQFVMIDPKMVQLTPYEKTPHLMMPVAYTPNDAAGQIREIIKHVKVRRQLFDSLGVKTLAEYNAKRAGSDNPLHRKLPYIVLLCTEIADLMMIDREYYEKAFIIIAEDSLKVGIHLYLATQRPSPDVLTPALLTSISGRIVFAVASKIDSIHLLNVSGAEHITGQGTLLYRADATTEPVLVQAPYVSDEAVEKIVKQTISRYE